MDEALKIEVSVRVTRRDGYNTTDIAGAKLEDTVTWPEIDPDLANPGAALRRATADVLDRVDRQLHIESARKAEVEREAARQSEFA